MMNSVFFILLAVLHLRILGSATFATDDRGPLKDCKALDSLFLSVHESGAEDHPVPACRCYINSHDPAPSLSPAIYGSPEETMDTWVGCTGQSMPAVYRALSALNGTNISHLVIWDSSMSILPTDMFSKVNPTSLVIESSSASVIRNGTFSRIGPYLRHLRLAKNILKSVDKWTFVGLNELRSLDLSENKIAMLSHHAVFDSLGKLESLSLRGNHITHIADGVFRGLGSLRHLDLSGNQLANVSKDLFAGLHNLETLTLRGNELAEVEPGAFANLTKLRVLDLGENHLERLSLADLPLLRKLRLNENHLTSIKHLQLMNTPTLESVHLDHNDIESIGKGDLESFQQCTRLSSLSLSANAISSIHRDAFKWLPSLRTLSLQHNALERLSSSPVTGEERNSTNTSFLRPLVELRRLHLSHNQLKEIFASDLSGLAKLELLALDHNSLTGVAPGALDGMSGLRKLFLNSNRLYYLPKGLFDPLQVDKLQALDVSRNPWECICGQEWLGEWLARALVLNAEVAASPVGGDLGCLTTMKECVEGEKVTPASYSSSTTWMVVLAGLFSVITIVSMLAIGYLLVQESCRENRLLHRIRRVPSDMVHLLPNAEKTPGGESTLPDGNVKVVQISARSHDSPQRRIIKNVPLIRTPSETESNRKTVRFEEPVR